VAPVLAKCDAAISFPPVLPPIHRTASRSCRPVTASARACTGFMLLVTCSRLSPRRHSSFEFARFRACHSRSGSAHVALPTLRRHPCGGLLTARGQCGSLLGRLIREGVFYKAPSDGEDAQSDDSTRLAPDENRSARRRDSRSSRSASRDSSGAFLSRCRELLLRAIRTAARASSRRQRSWTTLAKAAARLARHAPSGEAYVSRSVPSIAGQRFSKSPSRWSPRSNRAWIRCCASLHVRAV